MDVLTFFGAVWISIVVGLFIIAMIVGCTFDRHGTESPKWFITVAFIAFLLWAWPTPLNWRIITWESVWYGVGIYVLIGLGYSLVEFIVEIRKSKKHWSNTWKNFKVKYPKVAGEHLAEVSDEFPGGREMTEDEKRKYKVRNFLTSQSRYGSGTRNRIIGIEATEDDYDIEPAINKVRLAEHVGCWTFWWPFYLIGLVLGDLLIEIFEVIADFIASLSGRFVKMTFKDVFK